MITPQYMGPNYKVLEDGEAEERIQNAGGKGGFRVGAKKAIVIKP